MRKLFALLMVCATLLSLTACSGNTDHWETKDVPTPNIRMSKQGEVLVSPLSGTNNHEDVISQIQNLSFIQSATLTHQYLENAIVNQETLKTSYECIDAYKISCENKYDITLQYIQNPDSVIGDTVISVEILEYNTSFSQAEIYEVLCIVYGDEFARYLCYASMTAVDGYASHELAVDEMSVIFERAVKKNQGVAFAIGVYFEQDAINNSNIDTLNLQAQGFEVFETMLHWNKEDMIQRWEYQSSEVLLFQYGQEMQLMPALYLNGNSQVYQYKETDNSYELKIKYQLVDNNNKSEPLQLQMALSQNGDTQTSAYVLEIESLDEANATTYASATEKAKEILRIILGRSDVEDVLEEGNINVITVHGQPIAMKCQIKFVQGENYEIIATLTIQTSTDMNAFDA